MTDPQTEQNRQDIATGATEHRLLQDQVDAGAKTALTDAYDVEVLIGGLVQQVNRYRRWAMCAFAVLAVATAVSVAGAFKSVGAVRSFQDQQRATLKVQTHNTYESRVKSTLQICGQIDKVTGAVRTILVSEVPVIEHEPKALFKLAGTTRQQAINNVFLDVGALPKAGDCASIVDAFPKPVNK